MCDICNGVQSRCALRERLMRCCAVVIVIVIVVRIRV